MRPAMRQANFMLPEDLLDELRRAVPRGEQSRVVGEALRHELTRLRFRRAVEGSFGAWKASKHPELARGSRAFVVVSAGRSGRAQRVSKLLLDSDVLIDLLRGRPAMREFLLSATRESVPCCSAISVTEVHAGMRPDESEATNALLDGFATSSSRVRSPSGRAASTARWASHAGAGRLPIVATAALEGGYPRHREPLDYPMPEITLLHARR